MKWVRSLLGLGERVAASSYDSTASKLQGLENMKRLNDLVCSGECNQAQLAELELGAETISLNLRKGDTDKARKERAV